MRVVATQLEDDSGTEHQVILAIVAAVWERGVQVLCFNHPNREAMVDEILDAASGAEGEAVRACAVRAVLRKVGVAGMRGSKQDLHIGRESL